MKNVEKTRSAKDHAGAWCRQTWDSKMTRKIFIDMAASFWFFSSFLAKSISFYFRNQIYTALGFQKYSHCNKVLYISPWTIPFYTSDVSLLTKKSLIFAVFYTCESGVLLKYGAMHLPLWHLSESNCRIQFWLNTNCSLREFWINFKIDVCQFSMTFWNCLHVLLKEPPVRWW